MGSLAQQSHPPVSVWITVFGGDVRKEFRAEFDAFLKDYSGRIKFEFVSGTMSLGYYGRYYGRRCETPDLKKECM